MLPVKKIFFICVWPLALLFSGASRAQVNVSGKAGLLYIPTAEVIPDGTFSGGYTFNPIKYAIKYNRKSSESIYFLNLVVLPRLEINLNLLHANGSIPYLAGGIGDRGMDIKYVAMTEKAKRPSIAVILSSPFGVDNALLTHVVVATKHLTVTPTITAAITGGFGSPYSIGRQTNTNNILSDFKIQDKRKLPYRYLTGFFGGVNLSVARKGGVMIEWDSQHLNVGAYATLFKHWTIQAGLLNGDQLTVGTSYAVPLLRLPKRLTTPHDGA